jgi:hypothetical protein
MANSTPNFQLPTPQMCRAGVARWRPKGLAEVERWRLGVGGWELELGRWELTPSVSGRRCRASRCCRTTRTSAGRGRELTTKGPYRRSPRPRSVGADCRTALLGTEDQPGCLHIVNVQPPDVEMASVHAPEIQHASIGRPAWVVTPLAVCGQAPPAGGIGSPGRRGNQADGRRVSHERLASETPTALKATHRPLGENCDCQTL